MRSEETPGLAGASSLGLSILIVNWNTRDLLLRLLGDLSALWEARSRPIEVLVVDNDSADGSVEAARGQFPWVRYLPQASNLGFAGGVNQGLAAADHELILLLNTDVLATREAIETLVRYAELNPKAGIVGPRVLNEDETIQASVWTFPSLRSLLFEATYLYKIFPRSPYFNAHRYGQRSFEEATPVDAVSGCVFLIRRDVVERVGGFDPGFFMYFEDTDLCYRARRAGFEVHHAPRSTFTHLGGRSSKLARRKNFLEFRRSGLRYFRKNRGAVSAIAARGLLLLQLAVRLPYWALRSVEMNDRGRAARQRLGLQLSGVGFLLSPKSRCSRVRHGDRDREAG